MSKMDTLDRLKIYQKLNREWAAHLSPSTYLVAARLIDNTAGWGRSSWRGSYVQIHRGIKNFSCGLPISLTSIRRAKEELVALGLFRTVRKPGGTTEWIINPDCSMPDLLAADPPDSVPCNKMPPAGGATTAATVATEGTNYVPSEHPLTDSFLTANTKQVRVPPTAGTLIEEATEKNLTARNKNEKKSLGKRMERVWRSTFKETYPDQNFVEWTEKEREKYALLGLAVRFQNDDDSFMDWLSWSIVNWSTVMVRKFNWMGDAPRYPNAKFLVSMYDKFMDEYEARRQEQKPRLPPGSDLKPKKPKKAKKPLQSIAPKQRIVPHKKKPEFKISKEWADLKDNPWA